MKKLGIYVQVPFCQTKCTYCNFHTGVVAVGRFAPYVKAVCGEIREHRALYEAAGVRWGSGEWPFAKNAQGKQVAGGWEGQAGDLTQSAQRAQRRGGEAEFLVDTVYFGGGTPSLLEPEDLARILGAIRGSGEWSFAKGAQGKQVASGEILEVTLEADPETVTREKAEAWVRAGINRVSFGVQSFVDKELAAAGRIHRRADIYRAVPILRAAGIGNISFDLIAGLPHQTRESWRESLGELAALEPEHVSVYVLEVDEGSRLGRELLRGGGRYGAGAVPTDDLMAEFYEEACAVLRAAGYHHYEISNWGKPGFESKHNLKYWRRDAYLGFGAGAHSFSGTERWANAHDAAEYVAAMEAGKLPIEQHEVLTAEGALEEELFLGLRQLDGIDLGRIEKEYGVTLRARFDPLASAGLVEREGSMVRLAEGKLSVSNEVFVELMR